MGLNGKFYPVARLSDPYTADEYRDAGQNWIQVYSRTTLDDAQLVAQEVRTVWPHTEIFLARNGWYAVAIGQVPTDAREQYLADWKSERKIPYDSIATTGRHYRHRIPVSSYRASEALAAFKSTRVASAPQRQKTTTERTSRARPNACYRISDHCLELSAKAVGCGFLAQAGADSALDTDTGAFGGAVSSAACTALISDMYGLPVSAADLALSAIGGWAMEGAQQSFKQGDLLAGLLQGAVAFGTIYGSSMQCETALRKACR